jgi:hypothetical protein
MTDDPEPVDTGHWEVYVYSDGAIDHADASGGGPYVEVNYGAAPNLQLHAQFGMAYDAPDGRGTRVGLGDTELGFKYRFINPGEDSWLPQVAIFPAVNIPTGNGRRGLGAGYTQVYLPVWAQKNIGKWTSYAGGGYWINPGPGNRNYWFTGWMVGRRITDNFALGGEIFHTTSSLVGRPGATGFSIGATYDLSPHDHLLFAFSRGGVTYAIDAAAADYPDAYYIGYQLTF